MARTEVIAVPHGYPSSTIFIDESGSKATANEFFVVAAVKVRAPGALAREIKDIRDKHGFTKELKFNGITRNSANVYADIISALENSDAHLAACVVRGDVYNPFSTGRATWKVHAEVITQLLVGCINRRELAVALIDAISTPRGCSLDDSVRQRVNGRLKATTLVSAVCLDSKTNDLLQVADLVASAILHMRRREAGLEPAKDNYKHKTARRLATAFDRPGLTDGREERLNIATFRERQGQPSLSVVTSPGSTA